MTTSPTTLRDLVADFLTVQLTVLVDAPTHIRAGDDVTHPTRVAARRTRSTLRVFPELFEVPKAGRLDEELQWWAGVLGEVRDLDDRGRVRHGEARRARRASKRRAWCRRPRGRAAQGRIGRRPWGSAGCKGSRAGWR